MYFETYKDHKNEWRWRLWSVNNKVIADSGEGYVNYADCLHGIDLVKSTNVNTPVK